MELLRKGGTSLMIRKQIFNSRKLPSNKIQYHISVNGCKLLLTVTSDILKSSREFLFSLVDEVIAFELVRKDLNNYAKTICDLNPLIVTFEWREFLFDKNSLPKIVLQRQQFLYHLITSNYAGLLELKIEMEFPDYFNLLIEEKSLYHLINNHYSKNREIEYSVFEKVILNPLGMGVLHDQDISEEDTIDFKNDFLPRLFEKALGDAVTWIYIPTLVNIYQAMDVVRGRRLLIEDLLYTNEEDLRKVIHQWLADNIYNGTIPSFTLFIKEVFNYGNVANSMNTEFRSLFAIESARQIDLLVEKGFIFSDMKWKVGYINNTRLVSTTLDFDVIPKEYQEELLEYLKYRISLSDRPKKIISRFGCLRRILAYLTGRKLLELNALDVQEVIHEMGHPSTSGGIEYSMRTIGSALTEIRFFVDFLIDKYNYKVNNPFRDFKFYGIGSFKSSKEAIPNIVIDDLLRYLPLYDYQTFVLFLVLMCTGARFSEVSQLRVSDLSFDESRKTYLLKLILVKTSRQKFQRGDSNEHILPIPEMLGQHINKLIIKNTDIRTLCDSDLIFLKRRQNTVSINGGSYTLANFNYQVNECIRLNNIIFNDKPWIFSSSQCRKSVAVELLTVGYTIEQTGAILGHLATTTTQRYYADIRDKKLATLDEELFEMFSPTLKELNNLKKEIKLEPYQKLSL